VNHWRQSSCATYAADDAAKSRQPTILTIDDDSDVSRALARYLSRYDAVVLQASHGEHGIRLAIMVRPDVIITDLRVPQGHGQDVVQHLKERAETRHIPIIVLAGLHDDEVVCRVRKLGVDDYFTKPVRFEDLCYALRCFIDLRERVPND